MPEAPSRPRPTGRPTRPGLAPATRAIAIAVGGLVAAVALAGLVLALANSGQVKSSLAIDEFRAGDTESLAERIAEDGPVLFPDASPSQARDIYVQHQGDDPDEGWSAFSAHPPGDDDRSCTLAWEADRQHFVDPCTDTTYPPDGDGLDQYQTQVDGDDLLVDLNA